MARRTRKSKPLILVFCEGKSELAYTEFLKDQFSKCAVLHGFGPFPTNLFEEAKSLLEKNHCRQLKRRPSKCTKRLVNIIQ